MRARAVTQRDDNSNEKQLDRRATCSILCRDVHFEFESFEYVLSRGHGFDVGERVVAFVGEGVGHRRRP